MAKEMRKQTIRDENELGKLIKIVILIVVIFGLFYLLTVWINKKDTTKTTGQATIQYDSILVGNILNQSNDRYYVLVEKSDDKNIDLYEAYLSNYKSQTDAIRVYYATLDLPYNQKFIGETTITNIQKIDDLRLKGTTLLQVEKGKITKTLDTEEAIEQYLQELTKSE